MDAIRLVLPKEHGSWSLALEPVALGLLVAPSSAGAALASAAVSGFFLRRPWKLMSQAKGDPRQSLAYGCVATLALAGVFSLWLAIRLGVTGGWWPLLPSAVAGSVFAWCDGRNAAREGTAEIAGAVAFSLLPAAFYTLAGGSVAGALALAGIMLVRSVPTILTVRTCLRIRKGKTFSIAPALVVAGMGVLLSVWLVELRLAPWTAAAFALVLAVRTVWLLRWQPRLSAKTLGLIEAALGIVMVLLLALTWRNSGG